MSIRKTTAPKARAHRADGEATRGRILEAAGRRFGQNGFAETTGKAICMDAGTDLAAINYHFGSRAGLYQAVLLEGHRRLIDLAELQRIARGPDTPEAKLGLVIEMAVVRLAGQEDWPVKVLARELLAPTGHLQSLIRDGVLPKLQVVLTILSEITHIPIGDPALFRCLISVMAPCLMILVFGLAQSLPQPAQAMLSAGRQELSKHLTTFALAGLSSIRLANEDRAFAATP